MTNPRGVTRLLLLCSVTLLAASGCGLLSAPNVTTGAEVAASPTLLPPPKPMSSPEPPQARAVSPVASPPPPTAVPTPIPPPSLNPTPVPSTAGEGRETLRVVNTDGQGANMRSEPSPTAALVRTIAEGTELEVVGDEREGGGRRWRNVRDAASGATGWVVLELLEPIASVAPPPAGEPNPGGVPKPDGEPKPGGAPKPGNSPPPAAPSPSASAGQSLQSIGDEDRAYLAVLQGDVDALGKAIGAANEQIERVAGRAETLSDPTWRADTQAVVGSLTDPAARIRAATPGPMTGEVHKFARNAADRADEAAAGLNSALDSRDPRALNGVRTTLVRILAEINNMNLTLLQLQ